MWRGECVTAARDAWALPQFAWPTTTDGRLPDQTGQTVKREVEKRTVLDTRDKPDGVCEHHKSVIVIEVDLVVRTLGRM